MSVEHEIFHSIPDRINAVEAIVKRIEQKLDASAINRAADAPSRTAGQEWRDAIQLCIDLMPSTAENPNEDAYQRGRFDGVTQYQTLIRANLPAPPVVEPIVADKGTVK